MADFPAYALPVPPVITPFSRCSLGQGLIGGSDNLDAVGSGTWPVNNKAYFYSFRLTDWATAYQLLFWVGATSSGNIDIGIYDAQHNRIVSAGTTAMSATVNTIQEINITDTVLPPGDYLLGVVCSTTAGTTLRISGQGDEVRLPQVPIYEQTAALPLPDPCTPVVCTDALIVIVACGIQFRPVF